MQGIGFNRHRMRALNHFALKRHQRQRQNNGYPHDTDGDVEGFQWLGMHQPVHTLQHQEYG